jgi:hypothetical protein
MHRLGTSLMAEGALMSAHLGPSPVSIHDDGHVLRDSRHV